MYLFVFLLVRQSSFVFDRKYWSLFIVTGSILLINFLIHLFFGIEIFLYTQHWFAALLLFFLLLQFNSFRRVGIILLTVPLATVGIFPGLVLSGSPFGFQSLLGVIALVGIVVNNAIVLLDVMDRELERGRAIADAVRTAVERRTRPILLTTATTVAGLLPLAFSSSTLWPPMAWAIISGLLASTVLTLLVIPSVCTKLIKLPVGEPENAPA